jgi:hypothetical protein
LHLLIETAKLLLLKLTKVKQQFSIYYLSNKKNNF